MWQRSLSAYAEKRRGERERQNEVVGGGKHKSINSLMSQQSGINQFHVDQFLAIR